MNDLEKHGDYYPPKCVDTIHPKKDEIQILAGLARSNQKVESVSLSGFTLRCAGTIHPKVGIVQVFARLAPSGQTAGSLYRVICKQLSAAHDQQKLTYPSGSLEGSKFQVSLGDS
jgi:hypothetical protein